jgi:hypothetical protein
MARFLLIKRYSFNDNLRVKLNMKSIKQLLISILTLTAASLPSVSNAVFVDLSGITVDGGAPTEIVIKDDEYLVDPFDIFYSFSVYHYGISWGSETDISLHNFRIGNPGSSIEISGSDDCGFGYTSGSFMCSGSVGVETPFIWPGDTWTITLSDSFDDFVNPDYVFGEGSYLAWGNDTPSSSNVPEPSTLLLLGAGIVGLGLIQKRKAND